MIGSCDLVVCDTLLFRRAFVKPETYPVRIHGKFKSFFWRQRYTICPPLSHKKSGNIDLYTATQFAEVLLAFLPSYLGIIVVTASKENWVLIGVCPKAGILSSTFRPLFEKGLNLTSHPKSFTIRPYLSRVMRKRMSRDTAFPTRLHVYSQRRLRSSAQSDQSLRRVLREQPRIQKFFRRTAKTQISLCRCTDWSGSSLGAHEILYEILCHCLICVRGKCEKKRSIKMYVCLIRDLFVRQHILNYVNVCW